jgi:hypothetical protein
MVRRERGQDFGMAGDVKYPKASQPPKPNHQTDLKRNRRSVGSGHEK